MIENVKKRGFSLVEMVLGVAIGTIIALVAYFMIMPVESWVFTQARRGGMTACSAAMARMLKEIRVVNGPSQISTFTSDQLSFTDINSNLVTFQKSGTDLLRGGDALARNVQALIFSYLDENGNVTAVKADVRVIAVELAMTSGNQVIRLQSAARIRNQ